MATTRDFKLALLLDNDGLTIPVNQDVTLDGNTLFVDASTDRVGIGTSSPSYLTHLYSTSVEPKLVIEDASSGAGRGGIVTGTWGGNGIRLDSLGAAGWVYVGGGNTSYIPFTIGTEKARFHSNGNFGIGTTSPENPMTIQDIGGSTFNRDFSIRNGDAINYHRLILGYNAGSVASGVPANAQFLLAEKGGGYGTSGGLVLGNSDNAPVIFTTNATERMRITSSGNVGIGTSSPTTRLSFGNYIPSNGQTIHTYQDGNSVSGLGIVAGVHRMFTSSGADLSYGHVSSSDGSTYTERMRITSSGNVTTTGDMFIDRDGGTVAAWLNIDATNGYQTGVRLSNRWRQALGEIGTHEASALEDFVLRSYNDAGGGVVETMYITRSNSQVAFVGGNVVGTNAAGPALLNEAATSTNPTLVPNRQDTNTGIGSSAAGRTFCYCGRY